MATKNNKTVEPNGNAEDMQPDDSRLALLQAQVDDLRDVLIEHKGLAEYFASLTEQSDKRLSNLEKSFVDLYGTVSQLLQTQNQMIATLWPPQQQQQPAPQPRQQLHYDPAPAQQGGYRQHPQYTGR